MKRKREDPLFEDRGQWKKRKQAVVIKFQDRKFETEYSQLFKVESIFTKRFSHKPDEIFLNRKSSYFDLVLRYIKNYCALDFLEISDLKLKNLCEQAQFYEIKELADKIQTEIYLRSTPEFLSVKVQNLDDLEHGDILKELEGMYKKDLLRNEGQPRYNILDSRGEPNFDVTFGFYGEGRWIFVIDPEEDNPICKKFTWGAIGETHFLLRSSPIELDLSNDSAMESLRRIEWSAGVEIDEDPPRFDSFSSGIKLVIEEKSNMSDLLLMGNLLWPEFGVV